MHKNDAHSLSQREMLTFFYKYRRRLLLAFFVPFLIAVAISFLPSPRYTASSVLIVRLGSEYVYQPELGTTQAGSEMPIPFQQDQIFKSEAAILASKDLHEQVIETIGLDTLYPRDTTSAIAQVKAFVKSTLLSAGLMSQLSEEERSKQRLAYAVETFNKNFSVALEKESAVINANFQHPDPQQAREVLDRLLKMYMEKRKDLYLEPRLQLAKTQVEAAHKKAMAAAQAVDTFKRTHQLHSLETQRASLLAARSEVAKQQIALDHVDLDHKAAFYNEQLAQLDAQERGYNALVNEAKIADDEYALATHKMGAAKAFDDLSRERIGSVRVIQPPTVSPFPTRQQPLIILAGLVVSLLSVFASAAAAEFGRSGFLTPEEMERALRLPVLIALSRRK